MKSLDDLPVNDAIALYYEKHHALQQGNLEKLRELKNRCPDIFDKEKDAQLKDMIDSVKEFQASERYKELQRLDLKKKLSVIDNDSHDKIEPS